MSKKEFMEELEVLLEELPRDEREEALRYYDSYFEEAGADQEQIVLDELGSAGRIAAQILRDYRAERASGIHVTKKGLSGAPLILLIIIAVITFPLWISVLATAFGLLVGLVCGSAGIVFGFGIAGISMMVGGVVTFAAALIKLIAVPVVGTGLLALALLLFGAGSILFTAAAGLVHLIVWIVKTVINWLGRMFHGRKEAVA